jgi:hypothetical protein
LGPVPDTTAVGSKVKSGAQSCDGNTTRFLKTKFQDEGTRDEGRGQQGGEESQRRDRLLARGGSLSLAVPHEPCPSRAGTDSLLRLTWSLTCFPPAGSPDCAGEGIQAIRNDLCTSLSPWSPSGPRLMHETGFLPLHTIVRWHHHLGHLLLLAEHGWFPTSRRVLSGDHHTLHSNAPIHGREAYSQSRPDLTSSASPASSTSKSLIE